MIEVVVVALMSWCGKFTYGEYEISSIGSLPYSWEWV